MFIIFVDLQGCVISQVVDPNWQLHNIFDGQINFCGQRWPKEVVLNVVDQSSEIVGDGLGWPVLFKPLIVVHSNSQAENTCVIICYKMSQRVLKCQNIYQNFTKGPYCL